MREVAAREYWVKRGLVCVHCGAAFEEQIMAIVMKRFPKWDLGSSLSVRLGYVYSLYGMIGIMRSWIQEDFPLSDRAFATLALEMCFRVTDFSRPA